MLTTLTDHTVPSELTNKRPAPEDPQLENQCVRKKKKLRVNFNLTIDIKQENSDDACVPQGPHSLSDFSDAESLAEPIPTTPGGKPQVCCHFPNFEPQFYAFVNSEKSGIHTMSEIACSGLI